MNQPGAMTGALPHGSDKRAVLAVIIGNWLEFYDFIVFTFFAVMIGEAFFPGSSHIAKLLGALATFGIGFLTRPLGAAIIGAYADRAGRRAALSLTLLLMAGGSALVAITPTYQQIGLMAPILLVLARLLQGFSCGGEVGPATSYLLECAPPGKQALFTALQAQTQAVATIFGSLTGLILALTLSHEALYSWGWRVPFLLGIIIAPVGFYIRRKLPETLAAEGTHESSGAVLRELCQRHARPVVIGIFVISGSTISTYVFNYMTTYAITTLHLNEVIGTVLTLTGGVATMAGTACGVWLERFGRKSVFLTFRLFFVAIVLPAYLLMTAPGASAGSVVAINAGLNFLFSIGYGVLYVLLAESFPLTVRASGLSIAYALSVTIFGGTTQFAIAWLINRWHTPLVPAYYQIVGNLASVLGMVFLKKYSEKRIGESVGGG